MTLLQKQMLFSESLATLIQKAVQMGYGVTLGECYRTPEQAIENEKKGIGIADSLHTKRLACDLNLFKDDVFLLNKEDYRPLGEFWESLSTQDYTMAWGGRFSRPDSDHFSIADNGLR